MDKHRINDVSAFSRLAYERPFGVPGLEVFFALHHGCTVGMLLWYVEGPVACYHLGAYSLPGYELCASFAVFSCLIEYFAHQGLNWLALGGGAGAKAATDGLARLKQGWFTGTRTVYFCRHIFDTKAHRELTEARRTTDTDYFQAYRKGELA